MKSQVFALVVAMVTIQSALSADAPPPAPAPAPAAGFENLDKLVKIIKKRADQGLAYASNKIHNCKVIEERGHELTVVTTKETEGLKFNLTKEEVDTFLWGQLEALKSIMYNAVLFDYSAIEKPLDFDAALAIVKDSDEKALPLIKPALAELRASKSTQDCLKVVTGYVTDEKEKPYKQAALARAVASFTEVCLLAPICKVSTGGN